MYLIVTLTVNLERVGSKPLISWYKDLHIVRAQIGGGRLFLFIFFIKKEYFTCEVC